MNLRMTALMALAASVPFGAAAQSLGNVTMYGIVDLYLEHRNHIPLNAAQPGNGNTSQKSIGSGGWNTSRLGFKGVEPLGDGLAAEFNLEHGMAANTGSTTGAFWARQAWVGLSSKDWGKLQLGRTTTTINDMVLSHDPMRNAPRYSWLPSTGSNSTYSYSTRLDNMIKYSKTTGPAEVMAHYSIGTNGGASKPGSGYGAGARWREKEWSVEAAFDQRYGTANAQGLYADTKALSLSGQYKAGSSTVTLGRIGYEQQPATGAQRKSELYWASLEQQVTAPLSTVLALNVENLPDTSSDPMMLVLNATYAFSKRTDVYVTTAYAWAKRDGTRQTPVGVVRTSELTPYYGNQTGVLFGLRHRF